MGVGVYPILVKQGFPIKLHICNNAKAYFMTLIMNSVKNVGSQNIQIWPSLRQVGSGAVLMDLQILLKTF